MQIRTRYPYTLSQLNACSNIKHSLVDSVVHRYSLGLGITSRCNLRCPFCYYHAKIGNKWQTDMSMEVLHSIFHDLPRLQRINIALEGEPFCHGGLFDILDYIDDKANSLAISTNGMLLRKEYAANLGRYDFSMISMSIEAGDKNSYERIRQGGCFNTFVKNAEQLVDMFGNKIIFNAVLFAQNAKCICDLPKLAAKIGVQTIGIMQVRTHEYCLANGITPVKCSELTACLHTLLENAEKHKINLIFDKKLNKYLKNTTDNIPSDTSNKICDIPWMHTSILSDGSLFPCCGDFQPEPMEGYSFDRIFNHEYLLRLRSIFKAGRVPYACAACHHA